MSLARELAEHAERIAQRVNDSEFRRLLLADLPALVALAEGDYCAIRVAQIMLAHLGLLLELNDQPRRPTEAEIASAVNQLGVRGAARALLVSKSTAARIAAKRRSDIATVPPGTPTHLRTPQSARRVAASVEVGPGDVAVGLLVHDHDVPTAHRRTAAMLGSNGPKGREAIRAELAAEVLLEQLQRSPTFARERAEDAAQRLLVRKRLHEEMLELERTLEKRTAPVRRTLQAAQAKVAELTRALDHARAEWADAQREFDAIQCGTELACANFAKALTASADPRLEELRQELEYQADCARCHSPPFIMNIASEDEQREASRRGLRVPAGGYDETIHEALGARLVALRAAHLRVRELKLLPLTEAEVTQTIADLWASVPRIPDAASLAAPLPTRSIELRPRT